VRRAHSVPGGAARSGDSPAHLGAKEGPGPRPSAGAGLCKNFDTNFREHPSATQLGI
jgi:hypothetical protein